MLGLGHSVSKSKRLSSIEPNFSLFFDGTNDEIDFTSLSLQAELANQGFKVSGSVSIWLKMNASISSNGQLFDFTIDTNNRINTQYKHTSNGFNSTFKGGGSTKIATHNPSSSIEGDDTWHHLAMTWDKGTANELKIYFDGSLKATTALASVELEGDFDDDAGAEGVEVIQGTSFNGNADYKGYLDDFAVFSNVLSGSQVSNLYNSGVSNPKDVSNQGTLIAHWKFNENAGTTVTDAVEGYIGTFGSSGKEPAFSSDNAAGT